MQRSFASLDPKMRIAPHMMTNFPKCHILQILRVEHEVSAKGTSIGIAKFKLELKTLTFIMFSNLYPLSNTRFINLGRA